MEYLVEIGCPTEDSEDLSDWESSAGDSI